ncbi:MAG TPA: alpha/beta hydrolase [Panacibacter sp.]|nr:alpha/beta hydrolase [Panacibacter sp.]
MDVYKHYNQEQLNAQYNNRLHVPDYANYFERWEKLSRQTEKEHAIFKDISYGSHALECLDIFPAANPNAKTLVFIHGGYWHLLDKRLFHFLAATFVKRNVTMVLINYPLAPSASMDAIVSSCRNAMLWLQNNLTSYGGDPTQVYIAGHSAGGHLAAMLLVNNNSTFIKGVVSLSGLFQLKPVMLSNINSVLQMDVEAAGRNSPACLQPIHQCPLLLAVGSNETDEFKDQTHEMYDNRKSKHSSIQLLNVPGKNHFSILDAVTENSSALQTAIFRLMNTEV